MSYNYLVTAHKATLVTAAITGSFTGPDDLNLIQAKGSNLVISLVTAEGLRPILDVDVFGRITSIQLFRPEVSITIEILLFKHAENFFDRTERGSRLLVFINSTLSYSDTFI